MAMLKFYGAPAKQIAPYPKKYDETEPISISRSPKPDSLERTMVYEENRRVKISVSPNYGPAERLEHEKKFFKPEPIYLSDIDQISHQVVFSDSLHSGRALASIRLEIRVNPTDPFPLYDAELPGNAVSLQHVGSLLKWNCRREIDNTNNLVAFNRSYSFHVVVRDSAGYTYTSPLSAFYLEKITNVIERRIFALAQFDSTKPLHQFYLKYLKDVEDTLRTKPQIRVRLVGHTDAIGTREYNYRLSGQRAAELASELDTLIVKDLQVPEDSIASISKRILTPRRFDEADTVTWKEFAMGESRSLILRGYTYGDGSRPQGRILNRRVEIELIDHEISRLRGASLPIAQQLIFPADANHFSNHFTAIAFGDTTTWLGTDRGLIKWDLRHGNFSGLLPKETAKVYVTALLPDTARRVLWIGTKSGLYSVKNDTSWTLYEAGRSGLTGSQINDLLWQRGSGMLVATNEGVLVFDGNNFLQIGSIHTGLSDNYVNRLYRDNTGQLWACT
ncbi:MAG: two-component regulator propeller domain-containing protein, partial [bacterium]